MYRRSICAVIFLMGLANNAVFGGASVSTSASGLCWRSLAPETGNQDTGFATTELTLTSNGATEAWLSWEENGSHIMRWFNGQWSPISTPPIREGTEVARFPVIAAGPLGDIILAVSVNSQQGTSALHIARWYENAWEWLGAPLISSQAPFTHAQEPSITFDNNGYPIVAWSEERHVKLAGLFVAQWDGSSWKRLGTLSPKGISYDLEPTVTIGPDQAIWLGWREGGGNLRVARWDGKAWHEIGSNTLQQLVVGTSSVNKLSLAVDSKGQAWVFWIAAKDSNKRSLTLARWNGNSWTPVSVPRAPGGKDTAVWFAHMILQNDVPIVAWSQKDATDNRRLYVSEWLEGDRWHPLISGLHLVEGVSEVWDISLSPADAQSFFISWDEAGEDKRRTRLVQAYSCKPDETPALPPKSVVERDTWPSNVDEAARLIAAELDDDFKARVRSTKQDDLILYHHSWGMGIRNSFGLWRGNEKLLKSCGQGKIAHPDECSMIIIRAVWELLQTQSSL